MLIGAFLLRSTPCRSISSNKTKIEYFLYELTVNWLNMVFAFAISGYRFKLSRVIEVKKLVLQWENYFCG